GFLVIAGSKSAGFDTAEWRAARELLKSGGTVVVLMGLARLDTIGSSLIANGCDSTTPCVVLAPAPWPDEQIRFGTLEDIHEKAEGLSSPAILVMGKVIGFGQEGRA